MFDEPSLEADSIQKDPSRDNCDARSKLEGSVRQSPRYQEATASWNRHGGVGRFGCQSLTFLSTMDASEWAKLAQLLADDSGNEHAELSAALVCVDERDFASFPLIPEKPQSAIKPASSTDSSATSEASEETSRDLVSQTPKQRLTRREEFHLLHATSRKLEVRRAVPKDRSANGRLTDARQVGESKDIKAQLRLERLVTKSQRKTFSWCPTNAKCSSPMDPIEDPEVEKEMFESFEEMLLNVDRILSDERLQPDSGEPVNLTEKCIMDNVTSARLHILRKLRRKDMHVDGSSVRGIFEGEFELRNTRAHFRAKMIRRRVIQFDRIVMPAVVLIEPMIKVDGQYLSDVYLRM
ncbi:hypothetical protein Poli38472_011844 [Pythium oligandrum]|uniref:Uncharacterized protein n=1 Tax=Pythium oligandrum TaxID=41045 RepID=A0A8K1C8B2_PYTOL|nr:hypothetical protein Poli38472_011844 [Pythium oligandrum]|eukprot:TMW58256.1 hypothetical protein Poli38472_011844 [Pythium oligandrum]